MPRNLDFKEEPFGCSPKLDLLVLFTFSALLSLWGLTNGPGLGDHEAIVAQGARQMRMGDGWFIPHVNDVPFIRKPPLAFWLTALTSLVVDPPAVQPPVSPLAARLPSAVAAILTTMLVYILGRSMFGHRMAVLSGAAMAVSVGGLFFSHNAQVEMVLTFLCTASFTFFWLGTRSPTRPRTFMALFYVSLALAMLAKAPLPLATVGLPLAVWWFLVVPIFGLHAAPGQVQHSSSPARRAWRQVRELRRLWLLPGMVLFAVIFLPWPIYVYAKVENALDLWRIEFLDRYTGDLSPEVRPFWYYLPFVFLFTLPFSLSVPEAVASPFRQAHRQHRTGLLFALTWATIQIVFLSTSAFKRAHYLVGVLPAFALLLGPTLDRLFLAARTFSRARLHLAITGIVVSATIGLVVGGFLIEREYPDLLQAYLVTAVILGAGIALCVVAFVKRQRALSLLTLHACVALGFVWTWDAIGQSRAVHWQAFVMAEKLNSRSIGANDRITWAVGRPDARLMYYMGQEIQPLFSPLELAPRRDGRRTVPRELLIEGAERITQRLASGEEEYFILDAASWDKFRQVFAPPAREVLRVPGDDANEKDDDWVVITNQWNTGEEEDFSDGAVGRWSSSASIPIQGRSAP